ncbi:uncharacterized protein LAESUDRAFT_725509 [Laetiporus sulphureus 93-53]|uniref:Copper acquisition factor BIM1-like domain-containing protein n=1 Tax=Laetiporus sulphureus 93-53 TaxID=1314785 RepID=A0A165ECU7_9APHY|nr:uncharacterized protein LAESUDRAFT_725509 [Laetiporus sulphureus 93-53]KZT06750.1 hypothetical protein LAESUDRAFT_725509 [Laetiporus sulphureus 93-53]
MRFTTVAFMGGLLTAVSAHFHLQYPTPRGVFNMQNEVNFCDSYIDVTDNRTTFPLNSAIYSLTSGHPDWTFGVAISTVSNPTSFNNFTNLNGSFQYVVNYFKETNAEGAFCGPIDIAASGVEGVEDGANVTLLFVFDGGDGTLYQCADLTLSSDATVPSNVSCTNATSSSNSTTSSSVSGTATSSTASSTSTSHSSGAASVRSVMGVSGLLAAVAGIAIALL